MQLEELEELEEFVQLVALFWTQILCVVEVPSMVTAPVVPPVTCMMQVYQVIQKVGLNV